MGGAHGPVGVRDALLGWWERGFVFSGGIFRVHAGLLQHTSLETACKQEQGVMGVCPAVAG